MATLISTKHADAFESVLIELTYKEAHLLRNLLGSTVGFNKEVDSLYDLFVKQLGVPSSGDDIERIPLGAYNETNS